MTDLEFDIRATARDLQKLYSRMDDMKHEGGLRRETRVQRPAPGPQSPGNWLWLSRAVTKEQELREVAFNAFGDIGVKLKDGDARIQRLLELIAYNAQPISELGWASDFFDELNDQARQLGKWINPPDTQQVAKQAERYVDIDTIVRNLKQRGHHTTPRRAREVAVYQKFDIGKFRNGSNGYLLTEFLDHYTQPDTGSVREDAG